jgi:ABC-type Fe3+/spermidine/putrescine transport system ATPase subunit
VSLQVQIRKRYPGARPFVLDAEFVATPGITILFGPSGSGKSTILECVAGIALPDAARMLLGGVDFTHQLTHRRKIGYLFQSLALFPHMTALENVAYGLFALPRAEREQKARAALQRFHVGHLAAYRPDQISGGERQRVALARTLVIEPRALLLDEPLSALDIQTKTAIMADLRAWNAERRIPIIYVTHALEEALSLGDRVIVLRDGKVANEGDPREVLAAELELLTGLMTANGAR